MAIIRRRHVLLLELVPKRHAMLGSGLIPRCWSGLSDLVRIVCHHMQNSLQFEICRFPSVLVVETAVDRHHRHDLYIDMWTESDRFALFFKKILVC